MRPFLLASVAALLCAGAAQTHAGESTTATPAKPAASAPTVAEVKPPTAQQQKVNRCNAEGSAKKLTGEALRTFLADCLKAR
jgi:hypothetical protein